MKPRELQHTPIHNPSTFIGQIVFSFLSRFCGFTRKWKWFISVCMRSFAHFLKTMIERLIKPNSGHKINLIEKLKMVKLIFVPHKFQLCEQQTILLLFLKIVDWWMQWSKHKNKEEKKRKMESLTNRNLYLVSVFRTFIFENSPPNWRSTVSEYENKNSSNTCDYFPFSFVSIQRGETVTVTQANTNVNPSVILIHVRTVKHNF